ncbi:hypothetical protein QBC39DRAFT_158925 [Podospora conica]|nr:hypothetical protein QBC39DRAFT_158925 [Schizothecium conicum]
MIAGTPLAATQQCMQPSPQPYSISPARSTATGKRRRASFSDTDSAAQVSPELERSPLCASAPASRVHLAAFRCAVCCCARHLIGCWGAPGLVLGNGFQSPSTWGRQLELRTVTVGRRRRAIYRSIACAQAISAVQCLVQEQEVEAWTPLLASLVTVATADIFDETLALRSFPAGCKNHPPGHHSRHVFEPHEQEQQRELPAFLFRWPVWGATIGEWRGTALILEWMGKTARDFSRDLGPSWCGSRPCRRIAARVP